MKKAVLFGIYSALTAASLALAGDNVFAKTGAQSYGGDSQNSSENNGPNIVTSRGPSRFVQSDVPVISVSPARQCRDDHGPASPEVKAAIADGLKNADKINGERDAAAQKVQEGLQPILAGLDELCKLSNGKLKYKVHTAPSNPNFAWVRTNISRSSSDVRGLDINYSRQRTSSPVYMDVTDEKTGSTIEGIGPCMEMTVALMVKNGMIDRDVLNSAKFPPANANVPANTTETTAVVEPPRPAEKGWGEKIKDFTKGLFQ